VNAFERGRVGLWVNNPSNFYRPDGSVGEYLAKIAAWNGGNFTDVFLPPTRIEDFNLVKSTKRPDGTFLKAQLHEVPGDKKAADFVTSVDAHITALKPGVVELDIEERPSVGRVGEAYRQYLEDVLNGLRAKRPTFYFRLNTEPHKAGYLNVDRINNDPYLYVSQQLYYGDMSPVSSQEALENILEFGISSWKYVPTWGAGGPVQRDGTRGITLPDILYKGNFTRKLNYGLVFSDDLMIQVGLL
jgi:hypothetical protein